VETVQDDALIEWPVFSCSALCSVRFRIADAW